MLYHCTHSQMKQIQRTKKAEQINFLLLDMHYASCSLLVVWQWKSKSRSGLVSINKWMNHYEHKWIIKVQMKPLKNKQEN